MIITILTLFPDIFKEIFSHSIIGRAQKKELVFIRPINIRNYAFDKHKTVDDKPYGGGPGMLMKVDIVHRAIKEAINSEKKGGSDIKRKVVLMDPTGALFKQSTARKYSDLDHLILICGHYEGFDYRIHQFIDESISIGRFVLTGGEIPAMTIVDAVIRLLPGVIAKKEATIEESYSIGKNKEPPQYTRPKSYKGLEVPSVLSSGNHKQINDWKNSFSVK